MTNNVVDYTKHTDMTRVRNPVLLGIVDEFKDKPHTLDTLVSIVDRLNDLDKVGRIERPYTHLRTVDEIAAEGLYEGFEHDSTLVRIGVLRQLGYAAAYGFYFKHIEGQQPIPKSVAIVELLEKGRWVVFDDAEQVHYVRFSERIGDYTFSGEGADPKNMGISDFNTLLRWHEEKRDEYLRKMGWNLYTGVYGRRGEVIVRGNVLQLPPEVLKTFEVRNPRSRRIYLSTGRYPSRDKQLKYVMALDEKAALRRGWTEKPRDTTEANIAEVVDGEIEIPQTFHDILFKPSSRRVAAQKEPPQRLDKLVIEAERDGDFFKIWGYDTYFEYFRDSYEGGEHMKRFTFGAIKLWGGLSMDDKTRLDWGTLFLPILLVRKGIINKEDVYRASLNQLKRAYANSPEILLHYRRDGLNKDGDLVVTCLDTEPFDGEIGDFWTATVDHEGRTNLGIRKLFDGLRGDIAEQFVHKKLNAAIVGVNDRIFQLVIRKPT